MPEMTGWLLQCAIGQTVGGAIEITVVFVWGILHALQDDIEKRDNWRPRPGKDYVQKSGRPTAKRDGRQP